MVDSPFIELQNITFHHRVNKPPLLSNLNMILGKERIGLIGPNGSGKTTLFRIIVGLSCPTSGDMFFKGNKITCKNDFRPLRKETGFLFQHSEDQLFSPTVLEDVAFGPLNLGYSPGEAKDIALKTLKKLDLIDFESRITHKLSGGEKKLVALATTLAMNPSLLLLDEPTNNLDPSTQAHLIKILEELAIPQVIISHDWDFLAETTSKLYTISHGHLHECDKDHIHEHKHFHPYGDHPHQHQG